MSQTEMLANRVRKNARHLGKWAKRERITCYRIYDRDIPELPITVDTYEGTLVINDYRHVDEAGERGGGDAWLDEMTAAAKAALDAPDVFVKQRERMLGRREGHQYEATGNDVWRTVQEGGHAFRVNLGGYVDTGLFLDHRITRARAAAEPAKSMLNLFAYTGSFSVYGAAAGMQTTTVDLSKTYLDWARENLALNKLDGEIIHADVREFLSTTDRRWDLAVVDPPTFSNSKRMDYTWDVQRDHAALLDDVTRVANIVWFSTNRRRFKLEWSQPGYTVVDQTRATIPPDFRDQKIHHAYRIARD
ncbi:MAG: class I SAM-dependent methyltransferase [Myxococcota bacterium]|nr:class I SAM-dependent methyltransferase [Deltaproteobacteria bacterium]MDQ3333943.1 class I SAM-dependent methyltransferase [Myxococcota bacterium]